MNSLRPSVSLSKPPAHTDLATLGRKCLSVALRALKWPVLTMVPEVGSSQVALGQSRTETDIWVYIRFYVICPIYHLKVRFIIIRLLYPIYADISGLTFQAS